MTLGMKLDLTRKLAIASAILALASQAAAAQEGMPEIFQEVGIDQRLEGQLPLDRTFTDETGRQVRLGDFFGERPVILTLVYYECPMLCTMVLNGLVGSLTLVPYDIGEEFDVVTVSIDPGETFDLAVEKKKQYLELYAREGAERGWHFLTGDQESIDALADAVGFRYAYDPEADQYAHASAIMVATPEGRLARYFYGIEYPPRDLRFALTEASQGRVGSLADKMLLLCYQYDPSTGEYGPATLFLMRVGGAVTVAGLLAMFVLMRRRDGASSRQAAS